MAIAPSLFALPPDTVLPTATDWVTGTLFGSLATGLCVIAVAFIGFRLMTGHLAIRDSARVAIGCFVLLGAPLIASGLQGITDQADAPTQTAVATPPLPEVPTRPYDPYAGASVWQDWRGMQPDPFDPRWPD